MVAAASVVRIKPLPAWQAATARRSRPSNIDIGRGQFPQQEDVYECGESPLR